MVKPRQGTVMTNAIPKGATWELFGDRYPDFWSKGTPVCTLDPDSFFPDGYNYSGKERQVTKYCAECPYKQECLQFAIENDEWGVWGGTTRHERKIMRKKLGYE
jgi:WhiB family redox-sensing transcriptional regulator